MCALVKDKAAEFFQLQQFGLACHARGRDGSPCFHEALDEQEFFCLQGGHEERL